MSEEFMVGEFNIAEGTSIVRPMTEEEIAEELARRASNQAIIDERLAKKAAAEAKLAALGLTPEDLKALN